MNGCSGLPTPNSSASFWHSQPSDILTGHHTTEQLPKFTDVVIVGSGISGAFAARYLAEDGDGKDLDVVMLEAREACWGATGRVSSLALPLIILLFGRTKCAEHGVEWWALPASFIWETTACWAVRAG